MKFASCDGCQLALLDAEDELLAVGAQFDFVHFAEADSRLEPGPYDIAVVEGSITTPEDSRRIRDLRKESRFLITIGACATAGGIQGLRNWAKTDQWVAAVYPTPEYVETLATSTPIADHVKVDFELHGCPINSRQLIAVLTALAAGRRPRIPEHAVCLDCKRRGTVCVIVSQGLPCLGPITQTGCGSICPAYNRGCYGCYGPVVQAQPAPLLAQFTQLGHRPQQLVPLLRNFNAFAPTFRDASNALENQASPGAAPP
jgi:coenzyme F420-reducing hydrogenase gamma subunit